MSKKWYSISFEEGSDFGVGMAPAGTPWDIQWSPESQLPRVILNLTESGFPDFLPSNIVGIFFSEKMKSIVDSMLSVKQSVDWTELSVIEPGGESRDYFMLRFLCDFDLLDRDKTIFAEPERTFIVRPVFSREKIECLRLFGLPENSTRIYGDDEFNKSVRNERCFGIGFGKASVAEYADWRSGHSLFSWPCSLYPLITAEIGVTPIDWLSLRRCE